LQKIRREKLMENPACEVCAKVGIVTPGVFIDHITPLWMGGRESALNRQTICKPCHDLKSAEEAKIRKNG
jgi:5-methylcytosine-specific restriction protein A